MATLRKEEITEIVLKGGSVVWNGRFISKLDEIPNASELAGDDLVHRAQAVADLKAKKEALEKELAELASAPAPEAEKEDVKAKIPPAPSAGSKSK